MKIEFEFQTPYGVYRDALYFTDGQPLPSEDEIEAMKAGRRDNWLAIILAASSSSSQTADEDQIAVQE